MLFESAGQPQHHKKEGRSLRFNLVTSYVARSNSIRAPLLKPVTLTRTDTHAGKGHWEVSDPPHSFWAPGPGPYCQSTNPLGWLLVRQIKATPPSSADTIGPFGVRRGVLLGILLLEKGRGSRRSTRNDSYFFGWLFRVPRPPTACVTVVDQKKKTASSHIAP
jgi:hypothetical protein